MTFCSSDSELPKAVAESLQNAGFDWRFESGQMHLQFSFIKRGASQLVLGLIGLPFLVLFLKDALHLLDSILKGGDFKAHFVLGSLTSIWLIVVLILCWRFCGRVIVVLSDADFRWRRQWGWFRQSHECAETAVERAELAQPTRNGPYVVRLIDEQERGQEFSFTGDGLAERAFLELLSLWGIPVRDSIS